MHKALLPISILTLAVSLLVAVFFWNTVNVAGSVIMGGEYDIVELDQTSTNATTSVKTTPGSVGTINVTDVATTGKIIFYDTKLTNQREGTTTSATTTVLFTLSSTTPAGSYNYDVAFGQGLFVERQAGYNGQLDVTYR